MFSQNCLNWISKSVFMAGTRHPVAGIGERTQRRCTRLVVLAAQPNRKNQRRPKGRSAANNSNVSEKKPDGPISGDTTRATGRKGRTVRNRVNAVNNTFEQGKYEEKGAVVTKDEIQTGYDDAKAREPDVFNVEVAAVEAEDETDIRNDAAGKAADEAAEWNGESSSPVETLKRNLMAACQNKAFGMEVSPGERDSIAGMVVALEAYGDVDLLNDSRSLLLEGEWQLQYSTAQEFRSSPFFWALQDSIAALGQGAASPSEYFSFVSRLRDPLGVSFGPRIRQRISLQSKKLVSEVDMTVQPPAPPVPELMQALQLPKPPTVTGTLVTGASVSIASRSTIAVEVEYTKIEASNLLPSPITDLAVVPVDRIFSAIRAGLNPVIDVRVTYLDDNMRITRTPDDLMFIYTRVAA